MIPVSFHPEAREELIEAAGYYENQQALLGRQFFVSIHDSIDHIKSFPSLYREIEPGIRQCRVSRFPYGLIYRAREDEIIFAICSMFLFGAGVFYYKLGTPGFSSGLVASIYIGSRLIVLGTLSPYVSI